MSAVKITNRDLDRLPHAPASPDEAAARRAVNHWRSLSGVMTAQGRLDAAVLITAALRLMADERARNFAQVMANKVAA